MEPTKKSASSTNSSASRDGYRYYVGVQRVRAHAEERNGIPGYMAQYKSGRREWIPEVEFLATFTVMPQPLGPLAHAKEVLEAFPGFPEAGGKIPTTLTETEMERVLQWARIGLEVELEE